MRAKLLFSVIIAAIGLNLGTVFSQIAPTISRTSLSGRDRVVLDQYISEYEVFTVDKRVLLDSLYTHGRGTFRLNIDTRYDWTITLELNDMRSPNFKQTYVTDEGKFEYEGAFVVNTFKGTTPLG